VIRLSLIANLVTGEIRTRDAAELLELNQTTLNSRMKKLWIEKKYLSRMKTGADHNLTGTSG
jgi:transcriptional regulator with GAF, ATPase, and Fis domain